MRNRGIIYKGTLFRWDRVAMLVLLISSAVMGILAIFTPKDLSLAFLPIMKADALFLMTSSHHQRRPPSTRAPGSGPSTSTSPIPESKTNRRPRKSRSASPLIVFYGMILGRPEMPVWENDDKVIRPRSIEELSNGKTPEDTARGGNIEKDLFSKDRTDQEPEPQEFRQRYENYRGRGRWGGYSLVAIPQNNYNNRTPLPVVEAIQPTTSTITPVSKPMKQHRQRRRFQRTSPVLQITDIQQYKDEVVDSKDSSLVVVRFYASWCKACKAIESSYHHLPQEFPSTVKFVEVPLTKENAYLQKGLGVPSLPFAHVYCKDEYINKSNQVHGADDSTPSLTSESCRLIDELKINKRMFPEFKRMIRSYVNKECNVYYSSDTNSEDNEDVTITISSTPNSHKASIDATEHKDEAIPVP